MLRWVGSVGFGSRGVGFVRVNDPVLFCVFFFVSGLDWTGKNQQVG